MTIKEAEKLEAVANSLTFIADTDQLEVNAYEASKMLRKLAAEKRKAADSESEYPKEQPSTNAIARQVSVPDTDYFQRDAERYRYLKSAVSWSDQVWHALDNLGDCDLDNAIDEAMLSAAPKREGN